MSRMGGIGGFVFQEPASEAEMAAVEEALLFERLDQGTFCLPEPTPAPVDAAKVRPNDPPPSPAGRHDRPKLAF